MYIWTCGGGGGVNIFPTWVSLLILIWCSISSDELREGTVVVNELSVGPHLTNTTTVQHHYEVTLGEEAQTISDKNTGLGGGREGGGGGGREGKGE